MKRSKHSLSNYKLLSMNQGMLVPIGLVEVLPGDTFRHSTSAFIRVAPLIAPVMHPVHVYIHHYFVPHRLVWVNFEPFITGGPDGLNASVFPYMTSTAGNNGVGGLLDYLGVPTGTTGRTFSALPNRGYNMIYDEYYRDQDLNPAAGFSTADGSDSGTSNALRSVSWGKDYFTTSRPWTQKGPEVSIPLVGNAPITGLGIVGTPYVGPIAVTETDGAASYPNYYTDTAAATQSAILASGAGANAPPSIYADLTNSSSVNINELRFALGLQRYEEARARYGSRYTEYLAYLGVRSSDARLQRPEYLGGGRQTIQFSEVLQSAPTTSGNVAGVGNLKGHGTAALRSNRYQRFFEEHGYVISVMFVRPVTIYAQGLARHWSYSVKEDFWQKELENLGQQEVYNREVYLPHTTPAGVFGYQDRYDHMRRMESSIAGEFRNLLTEWHMARIFSADPALNASFVTANPTNRIYVSTATQQLYVMANHSIQARRMVSKIASPKTF